MSAILEDFFCSSEKLEQNTLLDKLVSLDGRCNGLAENLEDIVVPGQIADVLDILFTQTRLLFFSENTCDPCSDNLGPKSSPGHAHVNVWRRSIDTSYLDTITWLHVVNQIVLKDDRHTARKLSGWGALRHLLNCDNLGVFVEAVSILVSQCVPILVTHRESL